MQDKQIGPNTSFYEQTDLVKIKINYEGEVPVLDYKSLTAKLSWTQTPLSPI